MNNQGFTDQTKRVTPGNFKTHTVDCTNGSASSSEKTAAPCVRIDVGFSETVCDSVQRLADQIQQKEHGSSVKWRCMPVDDHDSQPRTRLPIPPLG